VGKTQRWSRCGWRGLVQGVMWTIAVPVGHGLAADAAVTGPASPEEAAFKLSLEELMNTEITSVGKKRQKLSEAAAAIFVITGEDIKRGGFRSIPEALRLAPGVEVAQVTANQWAITIRGFNGIFANKLLVLIDGREVYTPLFGGVFWDVQDTLLEDVERIEVVRGPGGTLWGQNAVNGVINVITKKAAQTQGTFIEAGGGNLEQGFTSARQGGTIGDKGEYRVYGKFFNRNSFATPGGEAAQDKWNQGRGGFRTDWKLSGHDRMTVQGEGYSGNEQLDSNGVSLTAPFSPRQRAGTQVGGGNLLARWDHETSSTSGFTLKAYYDRTQRVNAVFGENRNTVDVDFQHRFQPLGRHDVVWGAGYRLSHDNFRNTFDTSLYPPSYDFQVVSGFVQDDITLVPERLKLIAGAKILHNPFTGVEYQPSGRLVWTPHQHHTIWGSISRAVRLPTRVEEAASFATFASPRTGFPSVTLGKLLGNTELKPEQVVSYELGYRAQVTPTVTLDVATFYSLYQNLITSGAATPFVETTPSPTHFVIPNQFQNTTGGRTYGAEVATTWQATQAWRLSANYSWLMIRATPVGTAFGAGFDPKHQFRVRSQYDLPHNLQWDTGVYYVSSLSRSSDIPDYTRVDTRLAWKATEQWEIEAVGQNLLAGQHQEWKPVGSEVSYNPSLIPRSAFARVIWHY